MNNRFLAGDSPEDREPDDFYRTPEHATRALLEKESFEGTIWEPACGDGAISILLGKNVISTDLYKRGFGTPHVDFLRCIGCPIFPDQINHIITNPPYKLAQEFIEHALKIVDGKVAMLLKLNFLEGQRRKSFWLTSPLKSVYVFSKRLSFDKGTEKGKGKGLLAYAWYVWDKNYEGKATIDWI